MKTKSIVLSAIAALAISGATSVNTAQAQSSVGYWTLYPQYNNTSVTTPIDTGDKLFYLAMNRLHSYDKVNNESYSYDTSNKLNDNKIINMFYFPEIGSLLIAYDTGNLDLLEIKTDKVVNMSDIADANINIRMIDQGSSELNIIIAVKETDYELAIRSLYHAVERVM